MSAPTIVVLAGGVSAEREVSLASGRACALALARHFPTRLVEVCEEDLPRGIDPQREVVFSTLHGDFGEDGGMQYLLDSEGIHYAGCGWEASALAMDKHRTKAVAAEVGVAGAREVWFSTSGVPDAAQVVAELGPELVLKPNAEGSSVGLRMISGEAQLAAALAELSHPSSSLVSPELDVELGLRSAWLIEERLVGRELSVGILEKRGPMGIVEICPKSGVYDYESKYTAGRTEYRAPAPLDAQTGEQVRAAAQRVYEACGCRDYARVDFILTASGRLYLLEINTLPGMRETSLLPMSARCVGLEFSALVRELVSPALRRFEAATSVSRAPADPAPSPPPFARPA
ncbi:hypothetical protein AXK11_06220 [Cephaloticoccus primus]|uniref:D-alanine--D-alanine ligase n=1 Tax=Cephaloticoccus primus TaxID=1548207 RepID=A0A139SLP8_9BACT|nr:D-alanine--D-alanine ligase [Cephaloticoccus primus]KXU35475.1 hypothetical protein AXK11_06220 [Cephaloticoccus primus]